MKLEKKHAVRKRKLQAKCYFTCQKIILTSHFLSLFKPLIRRKQEIVLDFHDSSTEVEINRITVELILLVLWKIFSF